MLNETLQADLPQREKNRWSEIETTGWLPVRLLRRLADGIAASNSMRLAWQPQANEVFAIMDQARMDRLKGQGAVFYPWNPPHGFEAEIGEAEVLARFVTSFATTPEHVEAFLNLRG